MADTRPPGSAPNSAPVSDPLGHLTTPSLEEESSPNQPMVFSASSKSPEEKKQHHKIIVKNVTAKLRYRKSTPAPTTKDGGRKRFIASPFAEDKQIRKKIDFGSEPAGETEVGMAGEPDPHDEDGIVVASAKSAVEASFNVDWREKEASDSKSPESPNDGCSPDDMAGQLTGNEEMTVEQDGKLTVLPKES